MPKTWALAPEVCFSEQRGLSIHTYSITTATFQKRSIFLRTANAELLIEVLFKYREQERFLIHGFALMPEHLHVLLTPGSAQTVERSAQLIKGGFSFEVRKQFSGEVWQQGFHEHRIRDSEDFNNQMEYIAKNPQQRHLENYPYVHTNYLDRLDGMPAHLAP
jgi:putative transposase